MIDPRMKQLIEAINDPTKRRAMAQQLAAQGLTAPSPEEVTTEMQQVQAQAVPPSAASGPNRRPQDFNTSVWSGMPTTQENVPLASQGQYKTPSVRPKVERAATGEVGPRKATSPSGLPGPEFTKPVRGAPVKGKISQKEPIRSDVFKGLK